MKLYSHGQTKMNSSCADQSLHSVALSRDRQVLLSNMLCSRQRSPPWHTRLRGMHFALQEQWVRDLKKSTWCDANDILTPCTGSVINTCSDDFMMESRDSKLLGVCYISV